MRQPRFEVWKNRAGEWQWHLRGANGEIMGAGEGYKRKAGAVRGVAACRRAAVIALLVIEAAPS